MTNSQGKPIDWLTWRSQQTGKSIEEIREEMRQRGSRADKSKSGFASLNKRQLRKVAAKGGAAGLGKKRTKHGLEHS